MSCDYEADKPKLGFQQLDRAGLLETKSVHEVVPRADVGPRKPGPAPIRIKKLARIQEAIAAGTYFVSADELAEALLRSAAREDRRQKGMYPA